MSTELEAEEREHRMRLMTAQSDAEKDLNKVKQQLAAKVEKERREGSWRCWPHRAFEESARAPVQAHG